MSSDSAIWQAVFFVQGQLAAQSWVQNRASQEQLASFVQNHRHLEDYSRQEQSYVRAIVRIISGNTLEESTNAGDAWRQILGDGYPNAESANFIRGFIREGLGAFRERMHQDGVAAGRDWGHAALEHPGFELTRRILSRLDWQLDGDDIEDWMAAARFLRGVLSALEPSSPEESPNRAPTDPPSVTDPSGRTRVIQLDPIDQRNDGGNAQ